MGLGVPLAHILDPLPSVPLGVSQRQIVGEGKDRHDAPFPAHVPLGWEQGFYPQSDCREDCLAWFTGIAAWLQWDLRHCRDGVGRSIEWAEAARDAWRLAAQAASRNGWESPPPPPETVEGPEEALRVLTAARHWVMERYNSASAATVVQKPQQREPVAESVRVKLYGRGDRPEVDGKPKEPLTTARYDVVQALIEAGDKGLTKDQLDKKSEHGDSRKVMKRLAESDHDWKEVLSLPGKTGGRYRIL